MKIILNYILTSLSIISFETHTFLNIPKEKFNLIFNSMEITIDGKPAPKEELKNLNRLTIIAVTSNKEELHEAINGLNNIIIENNIYGIDFIIYIINKNIQFPYSNYKNIAISPYSYPIIYDKHDLLRNNNRHINLEQLNYFVIDNERNILASSNKIDKKFKNLIETLISESPLFKDSMIKGIKEKAVY